MTLRSRLTAAFLAISVVPLSAVTLYSYVSSERALRRAAEQQANTLADELGHRMQWVTAELERRMDRAWMLPTQPPARASASNARPQAPAPPSVPEQMAGRLAGVLGDIAPMVDAVEFTPTPGRPAGPSGAAPVEPVPLPPPPGAPPEPRRRQPPQRPGPVVSNQTVIEVSAVVAEAMKQYQSGKTPASQAEIAAWTAQLQQQIRLGLAQAPTMESRSRSAGARGTAAGGLPAAGDSTQEPGARTRSVTVLTGNALRTEVHQDGRPVGQIRARINTERLFRALLGMTERERKEIPFAVDADGQLHTPRSSDRATVESLKLTSALPPEGTSSRSVNDWVIATRKDPSGATFGIARPLGDELRDLRRVSIRNFGAGFGLIALVFVGSIPLAGSMTRNLRTLMDAVHRLSAGDLSTRVEVKSRDEFGKLGSAFNQMAENLAAHETLVVKQERIRRELELCRLIQNEMLPHQPLRLRLAEVKGVSIPAREVGGDFFNYFVLPGGEIAVLVGDVSGKGVGAALLMANVQATLRARLPLEQDLAKLADELDRDLEANTPIEVYSTLFVGIVDTKRRELRYVNAGHNSQFVLRKQGGFERLASTGRPLGLIAGAGYEEISLPLDDGDVLFFYTDGMLEAENEAGEFLGTERLESALASSPGSDVDTILAHVEDAVRTFRGSAELFDDATMMALRFGANQPTQTLV